MTAAAMARRFKQSSCLLTGTPRSRTDRLLPGFAWPSGGRAYFGFASISIARSSRSRASALESW